MLKKQNQNRRVVCGYNYDDLGQVVITTGLPRQYNNGKTTYVKQKTMNESKYLAKQLHHGNG